MISDEQLEQIISEVVEEVLEERCQKGYKTHPKRKTKIMFGRRYRNCVKAEQKDIGLTEDELDELRQLLESDEDLEESLRDWFAKSSGKTKSGKRVRGWGQVGGKWEGAPCARQPGQKTVPKCVSSAKRRSMSKKERESPARRKRRKHKGQTKKRGAAKPTYVSTDPQRKRKKKKRKSRKKKKEQ